MPVADRDLIFYGSANHQESDTGVQGGAIATAKSVVFNDISPSGNLQVVSSAAGDTTQTVTVTGRNAAGEIIAETKTLTGTAAVAMTANTTWERLLKALKSATTAGDVAVEEATPERTGTAQGGSASTITLDAGASATDDAYNDMIVRITAGTGAGQIRRIHDYVGATKVATVERDWATAPDATSVFRVSQGMHFAKAPVEITEVRRLFYNAAADAPGGAARDYYEKVFVKNTHATLSLTGATIAEQADPSGKITFALATALDDTGTAADRRTAPASGVTAFDNAVKNVANAQNHSPGAAQGVWLKLTLAAGDAPLKTTYTLRENGQSI